ncbi:MAG: SulP family inorganic anion transporter, partial [Spirochaetia bacterium]|nr:SulP family inorganic anion transporter [Spirochaetia bacterium]
LDVFKMLSSVAHTHLPTLGIGLLAFTIMILMKKLTPPSIARTNVLVAVITCTLLSFYLGFEKSSLIHSDQIADPQAKESVINYIQINNDITTLTNEITLKSNSLRQLEKSNTNSRKLLSIKHDIDILKLEEESRENEKKYRKNEIQQLRFERIPGTDGNPDQYYLENNLPSGLKSDGFSWHIKKLQDGEIKMMGGGDVVGNIPGGLPSLSIPNLSWDGILQLISAAFVISLVAFMEAISMAKALAARTRQKVEPNQELIGQGLANISGSFFQSYPVTGSFTGSAINLDAGAKTGMGSVFNGLFVAITLLFLTPLLYYLPTTVLSAIIIMAVGSLINFKAIKRTWQANRNDGIVAIVSFVLTLAFAPHLDRGVLIGAGLALILYLYRTMQPRVAILARHKDGTLRDAISHKLNLCKEITMMRFDGQLYFANTSFFEDTVLDRVANKPGLRYVIVSGSGINNIDATSEEMLHHLSEQLEKLGIEILFCGLKQQVVNVLMRTGLYEQIGEEHFFRTEEQALEYAWEKLGDNHKQDCPLNIVTSTGK